MSFGVTANGFIVKPYTAILESLKLEAQNLFGSDIDLSENSKLLYLLKLMAYVLDNSWQTAEDIYYSGYVDFASDESLDYVGALVGFNRNPAAKATGTVTFSRSSAAPSDINIPKGTRVATSDESIVFETTEAVTLLSGNTSVDANIEAVEPGANGNVSSSTITVIIDPVSGIESVNNGSATSGGRDKETDAAFRYRIKNEITSLGKGSLDAIRGAILAVTDVTDAIMEENDTATDNTGSEGLPPKSFRATVLGGTDDDVAQAIFDSKPCGIEPYGATTGTAYDDDGNNYSIGFRRPSTIDIYVDVDVTSSGEVTTQEVKDAVKSYINGLTIDEDVIYNKVVAAVMEVEDVADAAVQIDTSSPPGSTSNITIADAEVAQTDDDKITVTIS